MSKVHWKIYYDDGTVFDSTMGSPNEAPYDGVVCIAQQGEKPDDMVGHYLMNSWDFYYYRPSAEEMGQPWWGCDLQGLIVQLKRNPHDTFAVKEGITVSSEEWHKIRIRAEKDTDFFPKSGSIKGFEFKNILSKGS